MTTGSETPSPLVKGLGSDATAMSQLERQNAYLKMRCAQLQDDVTNLDAHVIRLQQELERLRGRRASPNGGSPS